MKRGEIWYANLDPVYGYEQGGERPVLIIQNTVVNKISHTVVVIPMTTNTRQAYWKTNVFIPSEESHLASDSVALCHQMKVLDKERLDRKVGVLSKEYMAKVEKCVLYTLGFSSLSVFLLVSYLFYWQN
jgi:mRNA interferase MazF